MNINKSNKGKSDNSFCYSNQVLGRWEIIKRNKAYYYMLILKNFKREKTRAY